MSSFTLLLLRVSPFRYPQTTTIYIFVEANWYKTINKTSEVQDILNGILSSSHQEKLHWEVWPNDRNDKQLIVQAQPNKHVN